MKEFLQLMQRFVSPYKKYIGWAILLNILSAVFNVFSFTFLIPILNILFKTGGNTEVYHLMEWGSGDLKEVAKNNFYYYILYSPIKIDLIKVYLYYRHCNFSSLFYIYIIRISTLRLI